MPVLKGNSVCLTPLWWIYFVCNNFYIHYFFSLWYKEIEPFKNQTTTKPHQRTKNQSFLFVPFHSNHSNTKPSTNKSNDKRTKKPKTQIKKKLRLVNLFIKCYILNYSTVTDCIWNHFAFLVFSIIKKYYNLTYLMFFFIAINSKFSFPIWKSWLPIFSNPFFL